jgi:hypothetical protein
VQVQRAAKGGGEMSAPRAEAVARRFLEGMTVFGLAYRYGVSEFDIEQCLRRHLERLLAKKNGRKR